MTSHDVVALVRRRLQIRKVGHCGTLDPIATGLLLLTLGRGTKIQDLLMAEDKEYSGTMILGVTTDTQDSAGEVTEERPVPPLNTQSAAPEWYNRAFDEIGTREEGKNSGAAIARYRQLAQCGSDHDPWCAIFTNAMFALCSPPLPGTKSPSSQSFRDNGHFVKLTGPA